jgi:hypothetical protein
LNRRQDAASIHDVNMPRKDARKHRLSSNRSNLIILSRAMNGET